MSDLSHEQVRAYLQVGRALLTSDEQAALDEHLRDCAACRASADRVARLQAVLTQTLHQRWDVQPIPKIALRVMPRLRKSKLHRQMFSYAVGLGALAALILLLQALFTTQLQPAAQSPLATESPTANTTRTPLVPTTITVTPIDARLTPTPIQIALMDSAAIKVSRVSFWPDQSIIFDRNVASDFSAGMQADAVLSTSVLVVAYGLRPDEVLPDCLTRSVPTDRPFWSDQADYAAGAIAFDRRFMFADESVDADRFVVRLSVLDAAANDRLLYCAQQVYAVSINVTPAPPTPAPAYTATPAPPTPAPTATPGPALTATPYEPPVVMPITDRDVAIQLALQVDRNWVQRDHPITMEMIAADPTIVTVQRFASQAESGFGTNATIVDGPVWVVTLRGRGLASIIGIGGGSVETDEVTYEFLERTGTLLGTSVKPITPTPQP
jgi:predicted anti-sigma-YlaC factor YlaD